MGGTIVTDLPMTSRVDGRPSILNPRRALRGDDLDVSLDVDLPGLPEAVNQKVALSCWGLQVLIRCQVPLYLRYYVILRRILCLYGSTLLVLGQRYQLPATLVGIWHLPLVGRHLRDSEILIKEDIVRRLNVIDPFRLLVLEPYVVPSELILLEFPLAAFSGSTDTLP